MPPPGARALASLRLEREEMQELMRPVRVQRTEDNNRHVAQTCQETSGPAADAEEPSAADEDEPTPETCTHAMLCTGAALSRNVAGPQLLAPAPASGTFVFTGASSAESRAAGHCFQPPSGIDVSKVQLREENQSLNEENRNLRSEIEDLKKELSYFAEERHKEHEKLKERVRAEYRELLQAEQATTGAAVQLGQSVEDKKRILEELDVSGFSESDIHTMFEDLKLLTDRLQKKSLRLRAEKAVAETMKSTLCPISLELMRNPVQCADGCTYSRQEIHRWLMKSDRSPVTNLVLPNLTLIPNHFAKMVIEDIVSKKMEEMKIEEAAVSEL